MSTSSVATHSLGHQQANRTPGVRHPPKTSVVTVARNLRRSVVGSVSVLQHADLRTGVNVTRGSGSLPSDFNGSNLNSMRCWIHKLSLPSEIWVPTLIRCCRTDTGIVSPL